MPRRLLLPTRRLSLLIAGLAAASSSALAEWTAPDSYTNSPPPVVLGSLPGYGVDPSDDSDDTEAFQGTIQANRDETSISSASSPKAV